MIAAGALAAVAVAVAAGYGYPAVTATNNIYTGCLQGGSISNLAIGAAPTKPCPNNAIQISWSQTGPQGATGATGPQGPKGDSGATGAQGPKGETGATGPQGPKGDTGATGPQGLQGDKGDKGDNGAVGPQGPAGPGLSDISQLDGTACAVGSTAGTVGVTTASDGAITLKCNADTSGGGGGTGCGTEPASVPNSSWTCAGTTWQLACDANFADVDGATANGCEVDLLTDPNNCGGVGVKATLPHATASCVSGVVTLASCDIGYYDADGIASDGCETQPDSWPDSFATASNLGTVNRGSSRAVTGNSVPQGDVDWFTVTFAAGAAASIQLTTNPYSLFHFEVWESSTSQLSTLGGGTSASYQIGATAKQLWIKVYSTSSTLTGNSYTLTVTAN
jgi:hypothetical protein